MRTIRQTAAIAAILLAFMLLAATPAQATSYSWNVASGDWFTDTNWMPNGVPGASDDATISNGGTCTLNSNTSITNLTLSSGTLTGSGTLEVSGTIAWSGGSMTGTGTTDANGSLSISGSASKHIGRTLNSDFAATWTGSGNITMDNGTLNIAAATTFDVQNDQSISWTGNTAVVNNAGTFQKSAGTGTTTVSSNTTFNNTGSVDVQTGTLRLTGGTSTGSFDSTGGTLEFGSGGAFTHTLSAAATITGGNVTFSSGTVNHAGTYSISGTTTVSGGTANLTGTGAALGTVGLTSGNLNVSTSSASSASSLTESGGTLGGSGTLDVSGTTAWSGGSMTGMGTTNANGSLSISGSASKHIGRTLYSNFAATWTGSGNITMDNGTLNIAAATTFDVQNDQSISWTGNTAVVNNAGTFQKSAGTGTTTVSTNMTFNNTGSVDVQAGTLSLDGNGTSTGSFDSTGATLEFGSGLGFTHTLSAAATITGGNVTFSSGTVNHAGSYSISGTTTVSGGTANLTGAGATLGAVALSSGILNVSTSSASGASSLTESGGTLGGSGTLDVSGTTAWSGGSMTGTGTTNANGSLSISGSASKHIGRTLYSNFAATWTASGNITMDNGTLNIAAATTFDVQNDQSISWTGNTATVNNLGTFQKSAGAGTTTLSSVDFNNTGTMQSLSGTMSFSGSYTQTAGITRLNGGAITKSGATMSIQGGTLEGFGTLTGNVNNSGGTLSPGLSAGQLNETGAYTQGSGGSFTVEIGGLTVGTDYDRAAVSGAATLNGTLNITLINAFEPNIGDSFTVMTFGSHTGDFSTVNGLVIGNGKVFQKTVTATTVVLDVVAGPTPTSTSTGTATPTQTPSVTPTSTPTDTPTVTPTASPTFTPSPTPTATLAAGCPHQPELGCYEASKSLIKIKSSLDPTKQKLGWKWIKGVPALSQGDFGDPVSGGTSYKLCLYDQTGGVSNFKMGLAINAGGTCGFVPCWKALSTKGWLYKDFSGVYISKVSLKGGNAGKPKVSMKGKGSALPLPAPLSGSEFFDQDTEVIVQFHSSSPDHCWTSTFDSPSTKKNDGRQFKAVTQ